MEAKDEQARSCVLLVLSCVTRGDSQAVNWIDDSFTDLPFATILLSDEIAGAATMQFKPLAPAPGPPIDASIIPASSAAAAGLAMLTLVAERRRRK